jgi:hypothetical protein
MSFYVKGPDAQRDERVTGPHRPQTGLSGVAPLGHVYDIFHECTDCQGPFSTW